MHRTHVLVYIVVALCLGTPGVGVAATLYLEPQELVAGTGNGEFVVDVRVADGGGLNALQVALAIPLELEPIDVSDANSLLSLMVEKPTYDPETRLLTFAGAVPGGFDAALTERTARLLTVRFRVIRVGEARIHFVSDKTQGYRNDGEGSVEPLLLQNLVLSVVHGTDNLPVEVMDSIPPEPFDIFFTDDHPMRPGRWVAVFTATDKGSGIASYGVYETRFPRIAERIPDSAFTPVESPASLVDQSRSSYVYIRAYDKKGNTRTIEAVPESGDIRSDWAILAVIAIIFGFLALIYRRVHN